MGVRACFGPLATMKRTNHRLDNNSHHTTHMKGESKREMAIKLMSRGPLAQNSFSFSLLYFPPGIPQRNLGMLVLGYIPPFAKINSTYKSSTCPVLLFSGNAWGEYRSVSINFSSKTQIDEWSRRERGIIPMWLLCLDTHQGYTAFSILSYLIYFTLGC